MYLLVSIFRIEVRLSGFGNSAVEGVPSIRIDVASFLPLIWYNCTKSKTKPS